MAASASASCLLSEDHFLCSICLDVFTDPVSTPCGHNFCHNCIAEHWRVNVPHKCPMCQDVFHSRPQLKTNTFICEMPRGPTADVNCDVCSEPKLKALKSCLDCLTSYCQTHLEPHRTVSGLKRHQLINPVENLEDRMCRKHDKPLELFCKPDQTCICLLCTVLDHKNHDVVPLKEERKGLKVELKRTEAEIQQMIQERQLKIQEIQQSVELSMNAADRETAEGVEVFTGLMESVQKRLDRLKDEIQEKQRTTKKQAQDFINGLELEICELENRRSEVDQLSGSEDHLQVLQRLPSIRASPSMKTWTEVWVRPPSFEGMVVRAVSELEDQLREDMKKVFEAELRRVQQFSVEVTLDPGLCASASRRREEETSGQTAEVFGLLQRVWGAEVLLGQILLRGSGQRQDQVQTVAIKTHSMLKKRAHCLHELNEQNNPNPVCPQYSSVLVVLPWFRTLDQSLNRSQSV
uniref:Uncharacterized protein n=1 Tax=Sphaeramia orbicularis TaxID=375764 RepID=A0A673BA93_9TELE